MIVVIPSCRSVRVEFLEPLIEVGARFIVVDDGDGSIEVRHPAFQIVRVEDRGRLLGKREIAIPRRNGACRDMGFYLAWLESDDDEVIVALDDDCALEDEDFAEQVVRRLEAGPSHDAVPGPAFFNILDAYEGVDGRALFPRGFPYSSRPDYQPPAFVTSAGGPALFNLGLWRGAFDVNAIDKLGTEDWYQPAARLRTEAVRVPPGALACLCSMNMHFRRQVIPAIYQLPMHVPVTPQWRIDRYGDIWGGHVLKLLMDVRGDTLTVGGPVIRHEKHGNLNREIQGEHVAHLVNDEWIAMLRQAASSVRPSDYLTMTASMVEAVRDRRGEAPRLLAPYLDHLLVAWQAWIEALAAR